MRITAITFVLGSFPILVLADAAAAQQGVDANYTDFSLKAPSQYFYRGIRQASGGFILQPSFQFGGLAVPGGADSAIGDVDWQLGMRNSLHGGRTGTAAGNSAWYEADFHLGAATQLADGFRLQTRYGVRHSPNGLFASIQELSARLDWDDGGVQQIAVGEMGGFHPHLTLAQELRGGSDFGGSRGTYLELGVEPTYQLTDKLRLSGPVSLGLSLNNYYELANGDDDMFGFLSIGVHAQAPMDFMPTRFGPWQLDFGLDLLFLGDNTEAMNGGDAVEVILGIGAAVRW